MPLAFEVTAEDIQDVFSSRYDEFISDESAEEIRDNYIHVEDVERASQKGGSAEERKAFAFEEIQAQIAVNIEDINLMLSEEN